MINAAKVRIGCWPLCLIVKQKWDSIAVSLDFPNINQYEFGLKHDKGRPGILFPAKTKIQQDKAPLGHGKSETGMIYIPGFGLYPGNNLKGFICKASE